MNTRKMTKLKSPESMKVARWLIKNRYYSLESDTRSNLVIVGGSLWVHEKGRWGWRDMAWLERDLYEALEDLSIEVKRDENGSPVFARWASMGKGSYTSRVKDVMRCLQTMITEERATMPFWRDARHTDPDPRFCIAFPNTVLYVGLDGIKGVNPTDRLVTRCTMPVDYDPAAKSELWLRCVEQWSNGDPFFKETLQRWWGYVLLPFRGYASWMYMFGKVRAGKGLQMRLCEHLLGGHPVFSGMRLEDLGHQFGLDGVQDASVIGISEVNRMDGPTGERASAELKRILGEDSGRINLKYGGILKGVRIEAAPWLCGNEIMEVGNKNEGLSSKMVPLYFKQSFLGRQDVMLETKLKEPKNLQGIIAWAVEGAIKLMKADPQDRWALGPGSMEVMRLFRLYNNALEQFLETSFVPAAEGFVSSDTIRKMWMQFRKDNKINLNVPNNQLLVRMEQETSWELERLSRGQGPRGQAGMKGMVIRRRDTVRKDI